MHKKEVKEDKFVKMSMQAKNIVEENYSTVLSVVAGIFIVIAGISFLSYINTEKSEKANALLGQAQLEFQNYNYTKARQFIDRLLEEYDGKNAAAQGQFLLANLDFQDGKYEDAKENFYEFINSYSDSEILLASGYAGYAACLEHEGNIEEAAEYYEKAWKKAPGFVEAANYIYLAGINYAVFGNTDKAAELFQVIIDDFEDSERLKDAKAQLILFTGE